MWKTTEKEKYEKIVYFIWSFPTVQKIKAMFKNRHCSRKIQSIVLIVFLVYGIYYILNTNNDKGTTARARARMPDLNVVRRDIRRRILEALKVNKGAGCQMPKLELFSKEVMEFDEEIPKIVCNGTDWVKCYLSECKVVSEILGSLSDIECVYKDIIYENDFKYVFGTPKIVLGEDKYILTTSDHVKVECTGRDINSLLTVNWIGDCVGFRKTVERKPTPPGREGSINVLIFGFDSTSRNGFIRKMPKSYEFLTKELKATILTSYNILGDGTPAALFPLLTGKNELEMPDVRKQLSNRTVDTLPFIFYTLRDDGYRTAYFEDSSFIGTFQYRLNGFNHQPTDHYLRSFFVNQYNSPSKKLYCVGDTPQHKLMMNITHQFLELDGKRFCFTFIGEISHDNFNVISTADDDTVDFLKTFRDRGMMEDTMLVFMGDHGSRFNTHRDTYQGKLEERLPLMALVVPGALRRRRPRAHAALERNAHALATPHDLHATLLDALDLTQHWNTYKVPGADLTRALTLFQPIPKSRSCSEAGIEPHWCACTIWKNVSSNDKLYYRAAYDFVDFINSLTEPVRDKCVPRNLTSIEWVTRQQANPRMLEFMGVFDSDGYLGRFGNASQPHSEAYQIKVVVGPGRGIFEVTLRYIEKEDKLLFNSRDISRTNAYKNEPSCINATHPHLNMFCYCAEIK